MDCTGIVAERTYEEPGVVEMRPLFPRKAIDPDAALVEQLRRDDAGAAEALVGAYGNRVYRLALRITGNASDAEEIAQGLRVVALPDRRERRVRPSCSMTSKASRTSKSRRR